MNFSQPEADILTREPGESPAKALAKLTHLCVAAHQDDIEIMAQAGIDECRADSRLSFGGVVVTNGAGSPRSGLYSKFNDAEMCACRRREQREAAILGHYGIMIQLAHPSAKLRIPGEVGVQADLRMILSQCRPKIMYVHNPADKHDTHLGALLHCLEALRGLPREQRPERLLGCEVWRGLDWLDDSKKVALDSGRNPDLARKLLQCFDSQISGKRYDLATEGRRLANATFHEANQTDKASGLTWAMDLSSLLEDSAPELGEFIATELDHFKQDVLGRLARLGTRKS